jgi:carbon-monoxide dehydrogenase large subunit
MGASDFAKLPHIGESVKRKEDYRFLTGKGQYTDDINLAAQTYACFVRSPHAHAKIKSSTPPRPPRPRPAWSACSPARM